MASPGFSAIPPSPSQIDAGMPAQRGSETIGPGDLTEATRAEVTLRAMLPRGGGRLVAAAALSGAAALVHELLWIRLLGHVFGHTIYAIQTVLAVFFTGIALGGWLYGRSARLRSTNPSSLFARAELIIALWAVVMPAATVVATSMFDRAAPYAAESVTAMIVRTLITAAVLIVPATMMGLTLPALVAASSGSAADIRAIYGANTLGAAAGTWLSTFLLVPAIGVRGSLLVGAAANVAAALLAWRVSRSEPGDDRRIEPASPMLSPRTVAALLFASGTAAIGLEVIWTRALEQLLSGTIYSFATVLTMFLLGIGLGSVAVRGRAPSRAGATKLFAALGVTTAATPLLIARLPDVSAWLAPRLNSSLAAGTVAESILAGLVLLVPTTLMGALFPMLLHLGGGGSASHVGRLVAANTAGSVIGPTLAAFVLLPLIGLRNTIALLALFYIVIAAAMLRSRLTVAAAGAAVALSLLPLDLKVRGEREQIIAYRDDAAASVSVVRTDDEQRLKVNNSYSLGGGRGVFTERRQGHLAVLLAGEPRRVLVLGIGTGNTLGAVAAHAPERLLAVDLLAGVIDLARRHFASTNENVLAGGRAEVRVADAARIARSSNEKFDLVVADLFHPWQAGVSSLYTREHFTNVRRTLSPGGIFVQWLPLYQLTNADFRLITRTFVATYPHAQAWLGNLGATTPIVALVGSNVPLAAPPRRWAIDGRNALARRKLSEVYLDVPAELHGSFICDRALLEQYAGQGAINTLDRPRIEFSAAEHYFEGRFDAEKVTTLVDLVKLAAQQDRIDRSRITDARYFEERLGVRALIVSFVAAEQRRWRDAVEAAEIASRKITTYDLPRRVLAAYGRELIRSDPELARRAARQGGVGKTPDGSAGLKNEQMVDD